ncbi:acyl-CoA dehydrogenase family protein [Haloechinothrix alba]|uniref:acyl-CoA dehydrogenase family protein n=1 Tax=Haloechinothrix alba TaxID=664784 RepID=UPI00318456A2
MAEAGLFRMRVPARYGGYECSARTLVDVGTELGRGDGSAAWTASVWWIPTWMVGLFPDEVQDEVFSTPNVRVCGTVSPSASAAYTDGGIVVNGKWGFISGARHSHWQEIIAMAPHIRRWTAAGHGAGTDVGSDDRGRLVRRRPLRVREREYRCRGRVRPAGARASAHGCPAGAVRVRAQRRLTDVPFALAGHGRRTTSPTT